MFYGSNTWDPVLIISQIVSVQCLFYIILGVLQAISLGPSLGHITVSYIFDWGFINARNKLGMLNVFTHILNSCAAAAVLAWIVERAKKCLDFGATCYIWHTIFCWWYSGQWPASVAWWSTNIVGFGITVLLGEWLCVRREMQDIPLTVKWGNRKESGMILQPVPSEDPDMLPPKPRLRTTAATVQRPGAAAAAAATAAAATAGAGSSTAPSPLSSASGAPWQPTVLQMATLSNGSNLRDSVTGRKKMVSRPGSFNNLGVGGRPGTADRGEADGDGAV